MRFLKKNSGAVKAIFFLLGIASAVQVVNVRWEEAQVKAAASEAEKVTEVERVLASATDIFLAEAQKQKKVANGKRYDLADAVVIGTVLVEVPSDRDKAYFARNELDLSARRVASLDALMRTHSGGYVNVRGSVNGDRHAIVVVDIFDEAKAKDWLLNKNQDGAYEKQYGSVPKG